MTSQNRIRNLFELEGKVALITGASKGIGEAMARGLAEFGAKVVVSSRKADAVELVAESFRADGLEASGIAANMGRIEDIEALVDQVVRVYGGLDIVINNAATNPVYGPIQQTDERAFDKIIDVNLKGPFALCKKAYPIFKERGGGSIMHISSIGGLTPEKGIGMYSVSKAALINLTKAMAQDWGSDNIRVNAICPGLIKTKFSEALWSDEANLKRFLHSIPLGRLGMADDIAGLAVYLASDASAYCTGGVYMVDGGYAAS
ncbi:glucose 1-dehydrogenase [Gammaproteobacteria bacterium]|jgi:dehydrogenase/reductase SDR family member 4|nr:glucose 1-dehydrogenase [Gammaproteobacteria bacterium]MDG2236309.1 glucose 1-dehydrogenase [Arenicellales bacterium]